LGKFTDGFRQHARAVRRIKGRRRYINSFPWHDGSATEITVMDVMNPGPKKVTNIINVEKGYSVGLLFELAGRMIITEIECPVCGNTAKLNVHWPAFRCQNDHMMWEQYKHEQQ
jgi:hypothetical protein